MGKGFALILAAMVAGSAFSQTSNPAGGVAKAGIAADLGTTALGLAMGASEANPLGLAVIPLKLLARQQIDSIPDEAERKEASAQFAGMQFGAAAANLCTLAMGNPAVAAVCFAGGMTWGYRQVKPPSAEEECFNRHLSQFQEAAATGRVYRVVLATCVGRFEDPAPRLVLNAEPDSDAIAAPSLAQ